MTREELKRLALISILILLLTNLPFLPGPNFLNIPAQMLYMVRDVLAIFGLLFIPVGVVWNLKERNAEKANPQKLRRSIYMWVVPSVLVASMFLSNQLRHLSRNIAIHRASTLIGRIEIYKTQNGHYPGNLELSGIDQPATFVIGVASYSYKRIQDNYTLTFYQNVLFWFNYEVVVFDKTDKHRSEGELATLYPSGYDHWKYYIYD